MIPWRVVAVVVLMTSSVADAAPPRPTLVGRTLTGIVHTNAIGFAAFAMEVRPTGTMRMITTVCRRGAECATTDDTVSGTVSQSGDDVSVVLSDGGALGKVALHGTASSPTLGSWTCAVTWDSADGHASAVYTGGGSVSRLAWHGTVDGRAAAPVASGCGRSQTMGYVRVGRAP